MGNPVVFFEVMSEGAPALRDFYKAMFDWEIAPPRPGAGNVDYTIVRPNGGIGIEGGIGEVPPGYGGHVTFYVGVKDIAATLDDVVKRGGKRMMEREQVPDGPEIALFRDPAGNTVGLVEVE